MPAPGGFEPEEHDDRAAEGRRVCRPAKRVRHDDYHPDIPRGEQKGAGLLDPGIHREIKSPRPPEQPPYRRRRGDLNEKVRPKAIASIHTPWRLINPFLTGINLIPG